MRIRVSPRVAVLMGGAVLALAWSALAGRGGKEALDVEEVLTVAVSALLHELGHAAVAWGGASPSAPSSWISLGRGWSWEG